MRPILFILIAVAVAAQKTSPDAERDLVRLTNEDRAAENLPALSANGSLAEAARAHLRIMMRERKLAHDFPGEPVLEDRVAATGLRFQSSGENVAYFTDNGSADQNARQANDMLMHSPPHRENILRPLYNAIGVAMASDGRDVWVVEDFARAFADASTAEVERDVEDAVQEARAKQHLPRAQFVERKGLRELACRKDVTPQMLLRDFNEAHGANVYTTWDTRELSSSMLRRSTDPENRTLSIATCEVGGKEGHGSFRVVAVFF